MNAISHSETFTVPGYECDTEHRFSLGSLLRHAQQIATDQCMELGITPQIYADTHTAFLLAKMAVEQYAPMMAGETLTLTTYPGAQQRAAYPRLSVFSRADGTVCARVDSRWILVDVDSRRILRRPPEGFPMPFTAAPDTALDMTIHKAEATLVDTVTAGYTRCDENRHINNTVYADIVCDAVPTEAMLAKPYKRFAIVYHNEVRLGERFALLRGEAAPDTYYFCGEGDGVKRFEAEIAF